MPTISALENRFCAEGWAFQIQTMGAGLFGTAYLSAQSVIMQIILFSAMLPVGMSVAGSIRVGYAWRMCGVAFRSRMVYKLLFVQVALPTINQLYIYIHDIFVFL